MEGAELIARLLTGEAAPVPEASGPRRVPSDGAPPAVMRSAEETGPETTLVMHVLQGALTDATSRAKFAAGNRWAAWSWILGDPAPLSFDACCHVLGLDPEVVRAALIERYAAELAALRRWHRARRPMAEAG